MNTETYTHPETGNFVIKVQFDKDEVNDRLNDSLKAIANEVDMPGFRKGKVPTSILLKKFKDHIYVSCTKEIIEDTAKDLIEQYKEGMVDMQLDAEKNIKKDEDFIYQIHFVPKPTIDLDRYTDFEITKPIFTFSEKDIERELENKRKDAGVVLEKETDIVEIEDIVTIEYTYFLFAKDDDTIQNTRFYIPEEKNWENDEWKPLFPYLIGMEVGEEKTIPMEIPRDYENENLAGKPGNLYFKLIKVENWVYPDIDDEFGMDEGFDSLEELKKDIKRQLEIDAYRAQQNKIIESVIEKIDSEATFHIAKGFIDKLVKHDIDETKKQFKNAGIEDFENVIDRFIGQSLAEYKDATEKNHLNETKQYLIFNHIMEKEKFLPESKEEIIDYYRQKFDSDDIIFKSLYDRLYKEARERELFPDELNDEEDEEEEISQEPIDPSLGNMMVEDDSKEDDSKENDKASADNEPEDSQVTLSREEIINDYLNAIRNQMDSNEDEYEHVRLSIGEARTQQFLVNHQNYVAEEEEELFKDTDDKTA